MIIIIYRSRCSIQRPDGWHAKLWTEYRFQPRPGERRESAAGWIHNRSEPVAVTIDSGFGRLGLSAESLHYLAERGERHCRLIGEGPRVVDRPLQLAGRVRRWGVRSAMIDWTDEELRAAGLDPKRVESIVRRLRRISREMWAMRLHVYGASGSGCLMHESRPSHELTGMGLKPRRDNVIADVGLGFDGGDW